ncbi:uncharacterized protein [Amphiura filiformis]|uniref:uncharacterized protein isoform X1 n=2 Tax=Amphiura filiformis TaxID=82378 RepID=UPI003B20F220
MPSKDRKRKVERQRRYADRKQIQSTKSFTDTSQCNLRMADNASEGSASSGPASESEVASEAEVTELSPESDANSVEMVNVASSSEEGSEGKEELPDDKTNSDEDLVDEDVDESQSDEESSQNDESSSQNGANSEAVDATQEDEEIMDNESKEDVDADIIEEIPEKEDDKDSVTEEPVEKEPLVNNNEPVKELSDSDSGNKDEKANATEEPVETEPSVNNIEPGKEPVDNDKEAEKEQPVTGKSSKAGKAGKKAKAKDAEPHFVRRSSRRQTQKKVCEECSTVFKEGWTKCEVCAAIDEGESDDSDEEMDCEEIDSQDSDVVCLASDGQTSKQNQHGKLLENQNTSQGSNFPRHAEFLKQFFQTV